MFFHCNEETFYNIDDKKILWKNSQGKVLGFPHLNQGNKYLKNPINNFTNKDFAKILKDLAMGKNIFGESTLFF